MDYIKVEGNQSLVRDKKTNSIVNTNMTEYVQYIKSRNQKDEENQKIQNLEKDVASIKGDLDEIKSLLRSFINEPR